MSRKYRLCWLLGVLALGFASALTVKLPNARAIDTLPAIVFVARAHLATQDYIIPDDRGPAGQLTTGLSKFAPGSKLIIRNPAGDLQVLVDTTQPAGDHLNPLGLHDLQSPDVSFDGRRVVFSGTNGPFMPNDRADARPRYSWRLYEIGVDGSALRQLTQTDRAITIPDVDAQNKLHNSEMFGYYDDLFPAYLADGRIAFSSSRYPSRAHYDNRPTFNLYVVNGDGSGLHRITSERGGALHPTPLPDGRILWSRWWVNFNQPSDTDVYHMVDNAAGTEPIFDEQGKPVLGAGGRQITGHRLADNTLVYSNTVILSVAAEGRLPGGAYIRKPPNTWHLMTVNSDGTDMRRFAWTPRYPGDLTADNGLDTYNAAQPTLVYSGTQLLVAYTTQGDGTMSTSTFNTGIRVARPGVEQMYGNTTESIAGYRWSGPPAGLFALHPYGLLNGSILFSQSLVDDTAPQSGTHAFVQNGKSFTLPLWASNLRYELRTMRPDGLQSLPIPLQGGIGTAHAMDAKPIMVRPVGSGANQWRIPYDNFSAAITDDPLRSNVPQGLLTGDGKPAYPWSLKTREQIALATIHNPNVYANPPLTLPYVNNSPAVGSVAFADIYIDANQFTGVITPQTDSTVRAIKWTTAPVSPQGAFTAQVPADTPTFIVLRDKNHKIVRAGNRSPLSIAQGNAWARPGQVVTCVGCHLGHVSGSLEQVPLSSFGWTNVAPSATVTATSELIENGNPGIRSSASLVIDRHGDVPIPEGTPGAYQDRSAPWISSGTQAIGQAVRLDFPIPMALLRIRLAGVEAGFRSFSPDYQVSGELRFFLYDEEIASARQATGWISSMSTGGTTLKLPKPIAANRITLIITAVKGTFKNNAPPAALSEIEVIGQGATPAALTQQPSQVVLPLTAR